MVSFCPCCNSKLYIKFVWFKPKEFLCPTCNWWMNIKEVVARGGLRKISKDLMNGTGKIDKNGITDENGYIRKVQHSDLVHRQVAFKQIYLKNKEEYPMPFSKYVIHHKDGNKQNNDVKNLQVLTKEEHEYIHDKYK